MPCNLLDARRILLSIFFEDINIFLWGIANLTELNFFFGNCAFNTWTALKTEVENLFSRN